MANPECVFAFINLFIVILFIVQDESMWTITHISLALLCVFLGSLGTLFIGLYLIARAHRI